MPDLIVCPSPGEIFQKAADIFARDAADSIASAGQFTVALAGGSTPLGLYQLLSSAASSPADRLPVTGYRLPDIDWPRVHIFFGDERCVPPENDFSNYRMANSSLLLNVSIPKRQIYRIRGEAPPNVAAGEYEGTLLRIFGETDERPFPRFDLILLGMGPDGHTASLFPGTDALKETKRWVVSNYVEKFAGTPTPADRVTLTYPVLNAAAHVLFMVAGADKADALREVLNGAPNAGLYPSQGVRPVSGRLTWLVDSAAAAKLPGSAVV